MCAAVTLEEDSEVVDVAGRRGAGEGVDRVAVAVEGRERITVAQESTSDASSGEVGESTAIND